MASSRFSLLLTLCSSLLLLSLPSSASIPLKDLLRSSLPSDSDPNPNPEDDAPLYRYFEVTKPIKTPPIKPCSHLVLQHQFGYTYGKPPVLANYTPPAHCGTQDFAKIVLEWTATCKGRQYDRIFGVWLGGVELLRSCTAEPRATGMIWTVKKDITRYYSLLMENSTLAVYLGNLVTSTYTGIYNVNITMHFYPAEDHSYFDRKTENSVPGFSSKADLILPISRNLPLNDGLWFEIENVTDTESKEFSIPQNVYRAVLEVYVSFHQDDEFWYTNFPNEYIEASNLTGYDGNGPFREVLVTLDGEIVGSVWPFTVIFTGGINPLFWRPITGIGSFDLPSYDIEITPFLAQILDGKSHELSFSVTNALDVWYVDANLHLWLDHGSSKTEAGLMSYTTVPLALATKLDIKGLDGNFTVRASRSIESLGWVQSSYGNITTRSIQKFNYSNEMLVGNEVNMQIVKQLIHYNDQVDAKTSSSSPWLQQINSNKKFRFFTYSNLLDQGNGTEQYVANVTLGFNENRQKDAGSAVSSSKLRNSQKANGTMLIKNNLVVSGIGSTEQVYRYNGSEFCYFRNVSSTNYTILYDQVQEACKNDEHLPRFGLRQSFQRQAPYRRAFLGSEFEEGSF